MAKPLAASKKVMKNYLSELLTDDVIVPKTSQLEPIQHTKSNTVKNERLETLLKSVKVTTAKTFVEAI